MLFNLSGHAGRYLTALLVWSGLSVVMHIVFQVVLLSIATDVQPYGYMLFNCE